MATEGKVNDYGIDALRKTIEPSPGASDPHIYRQRVCVANTGSEPIPIDATLVESAITKGTAGMKTSTITVTSTAAKIPATPLADRNTISIQNFSSTDTVYVGTIAGVTAARTPGSTTDGTEIGALETWNYAINDSSEIFAITESGKTALVKVTETA